MASSPLTPYARNALEQAIQSRRARANAVSLRRSTKSATPKLPLAEERALERYLTTLTREAADEVRELVARGVSINDLLPLEQQLGDIRLRLAERIQSSEVSEIVDAFGRRVNAKNLADTARVLRMSPDALPPSVRSVLDAFRRENVRLIGSVLDDQISEVSELVRDAVRTGRRVEDLAEDIEARFGVSTSRARLIARDQVLKANSAMTQTRMTAAGVSRYRWSTSRDERVRPMHRELEGQIFNWSDPPITNEKGDRNHPGEDINCRCVPVAVLDFEEEDEDARRETEAETAMRKAFKGTAPTPRASTGRTPRAEEPDDEGPVTVRAAQRTGKRIPQAPADIRAAEAPKPAPTRRAQRAVVPTTTAAAAAKPRPRRAAAPSVEREAPVSVRPEGRRRGARIPRPPGA